MRKRSTLIVTILILLILGYCATLYFVFPEQIKNPLYLSPIALLIVILVFYIGSVIYVKKKFEDNNKLKNELSIQKELYSSLSKNNEVVSKDLPVGLIIYDEEMNITFANDFANSIFQAKLLGKEISFISAQLLESIQRNERNFEIVVYEKIYKVEGYFEKKTLYLMDITEERKTQENFDSTRPAIMILSLDNLDESLNGCDLKDRTEILGKYYLAIEMWGNKFNIYGETNPNNKQTFIITKKELEMIVEDDFSILSDFTDISKSLGIDISLSIGVGTEAPNYSTLAQYAEKGLEYASDRGGNQAIIFNGSKTTIYGAKTNSVAERVSRVTTRIFAEKLVEQIKKSSSVVVMPHIDTDADAIGAALGINQLCEILKTPCKVLLNMGRVDSTVKKVIDTSSTEYIKLRQSFITDEDLEAFFTGSTLLILVDHCDKDLSPSKEVYKYAKTLYVIDHHRKNTKGNLNINEDYIDTNASSSVELVTDMLSVLPYEITIPPFIATTMLLGITIDTNNFASHVSDKTFDSASFLMKNDADAFRVKMYLRESISNQRKRVKLLENAQIIDDKFAVVIDDGVKLSRDTLAKTAEALLNIDNIVAGFAIGRLEEGATGISARSNGSFNIHIEMEKFGGGGHYNMGAAQIRDGRTPKEVCDELIENLKRTMKGDKDIVKVILVEDVKKQGKKGDIIECSPGYANYLMSKKSAIEANAANIAVLEEEKATQEKTKQQELIVAQKLKEILDELTVTIRVKTGDNGKFFGSVSTKQISDCLSKQFDIDVDKRKISLPNEKIDSLGTFECVVKLHKDVQSNLKIDVKEEED